MKSVLAILTIAGGACAADYTTNIADANEYRVAKIVVDGAGNTYVAGSRVFETLSDIFVAKLDRSGKVLFTATYSGKGSDTVNDLAIDGSGNMYLAGSTSSVNFPLRNPLQSQPSSGGTGFLMKIGADGSQLIFSTYFGGTRSFSSVNALALDAAGNIYLAGQTISSDFPVTGSLRFGPAPSWGVPINTAAFFAKLPPAADRIAFAGTIAGGSVACGAGSSCFLSARNTSAVAIGVDANGNVIIGGNTNITDLATTTGAMVPKGIGGFVASVKGDGTSLRYLTYLGARNDILVPWANPGTQLSGLAVDAAGNAIVCGATNDEKFPATPGVVQGAYSGPVVPQGPVSPQRDGFVAKLKPDGTGVVWGTYLGGRSADAATSVTTDTGGNVWVSGTTSSGEFPNSGGWGTGADFIAGLKGDGSALIYSARFPAESTARSIAVDAGGVVHAAGLSGLVSAITPGQAPTPRVVGITNAAGSRISARFAPGEIISLYGPGIGPETPYTTTFDSLGRVATTLGGIRVLIGGIAAPLLYVSRTQINAVVPLAIAAGSRPVVSIVSSGGTLPDFAAVTIRDDPQIFRNADGSAAAVNQDGTVNSRSNPAKAGSIIAIWVTGVDNVRGGDGVVAQTADDFYCCAASASTQDAEVLYAGASPGFVTGAVQMNVRLPSSFHTSVELVIRSRASNRTSAYASVWVTP